MRCAAQLNTTESDLFVSWRIESLKNNEIALMIKLGDLASVLKSGTRSVSDVKLMLAKRENQACLVLHLQTMDGFDVTQDIPVRTMQTELVDPYREPNLPDPNVILYFPGLQVYAIECDTHTCAHDFMFLLP